MRICIELFYVGLRNEDWERLLNDTMIRRIQYMYRVWKCRQKRRAKMWHVINRNSIAIRAKQRKCVRFVEKAHRGSEARIKFKKQLHMVYEKVWDIERGRLFWVNHQTGEKSWDRPWLLWRYGDVETPSPWVAIPEGMDDDASVDTVNTDGSLGLNVDNDKNSPKTKTYHFWHCTAKRSIPRKPDGLLICQRCDVNLALRRCVQCDLVYCFICHRETHSNPMNFLQHTRATSEQLMDPSFLDRLDKHRQHTYGSVDPIVCNLCKSVNNGGLLAAFHCIDCGNKNMCRPCYRRLHGHNSQMNHRSYII